MSNIDDLLKAFSKIELTTAKPKASPEETARIRAQYQEKIRRGKLIDVHSSEYYESSVVLGEVWGVSIPTNIRELRSSSELLRWGECTCRLAKYPFEMGTVRAAYFAKVRLKDASEWKDMIVKEFIMPHDRTVKEYQNQSENSAVAFFLCEEYNKIHLSTSRRIRAIRSRILKLRQSDGSERLFNMEEKLRGNWKKWTNNAGGILERNVDLINLAKWSHTISRGYLLLSDLQGAETASEIILTDPAVLCTDLNRFGPTNFHSIQMKTCLDALNGKVDHRLDPLRGSTIRKPGFSVTCDTKMRELRRGYVRDAADLDKLPATPEKILYPKYEALGLKEFRDPFAGGAPPIAPRGTFDIDEALGIKEYRDPFAGGAPPIAPRGTFDIDEALGIKEYRDPFAGGAPPIAPRGTFDIDEALGIKEYRDPFAGGAPPIAPRGTFDIDEALGIKEYRDPFAGGAPPIAPRGTFDIDEALGIKEYRDPFAGGAPPIAPRGPFDRCPHCNTPLVLGPVNHKISCPANPYFRGW